MVTNLLSWQILQCLFLISIHTNILNSFCPPNKAIEAETLVWVDVQSNVALRGKKVLMCDQVQPIISKKQKEKFFWKVKTKPKCPVPTVGTKQMLTSFSHFAWLPEAISSLSIFILTLLSLRLGKHKDFFFKGSVP